MLTTARWATENEPETAEVIPLRAFDPTACAAEIMELDCQARDLGKLLAQERRRYEETISVMENDLETINKELEKHRTELREWTRNLGV